MHKVWVSDCGSYYCVSIQSERLLGYDVLEINGPGIWLDQRQHSAQGSEFPRFAHMVDSWSNLGREKRKRNGTREWIPAFEIGFADLDQSIRIIPLTGNTVLRSYSAKFYKQQRVSKKTWGAIQERIRKALEDGLW